MTTTTVNSTAAIEFCLEWKSAEALHKEFFYAEKVNFWRDIVPKPLYQSVLNKLSGDTVQIQLNSEEGFFRHDPGKIFQIRKNQFDSGHGMKEPVLPRIGRFYPKGFLKDMPNVFRVNVEPFRCVGNENGQLRVDFNHPLSGKPLTVSAKILEVFPKLIERGGTSTDWLDTIASGPGMQARWNDLPTDFFSGRPFQRDDESPDAEFYERPRLVQHIDSCAIDHIRNLYGELIPETGSILDLMCSWTSHLPKSHESLHVTGLGLNKEELAANKQLSAAVVHDLNDNPALPFPDASFNAVICSVSVEYLTRPFDVFSEAARVLKPECPLIVTFSNRWFPPKAINIWKEIHEFERPGLVTEYFLQTGKFDRLSVVTRRGYPRPEDDKYVSQFVFSDPVYAVWGYKRKTPNSNGAEQ